MAKWRVSYYDDVDVYADDEDDAKHEARHLLFDDGERMVCFTVKKISDEEEEY